jgi:hypothetical protein
VAIELEDLARKIADRLRPSVPRPKSLRRFSLGSLIVFSTMAGIGSGIVFAGRTANQPSTVGEFILSFALISWAAVSVGLSLWYGVYLVKIVAVGNPKLVGWSQFLIWVSVLANLFLSFSLLYLRRRGCL